MDAPSAAGVDAQGAAVIDPQGAAVIDPQGAAAIMQQARERAGRELRVRRPVLFVTWGLVPADRLRRDVAVGARAAPGAAR